MEERHWKIVQDILSKYPYTFYAFGSRVKGGQESDLPFKVDLVDWNLLSPEFQSLIKKDLSLIQTGKKH